MMADAAEAAPEGPPEIATVEVWRHAPARPKRSPRKPRAGDASRQAAPERDGREPRRRSGTPHRSEGKRRPRPGEPKGSERQPWQERPARKRAFDPDSPFAALEALKKELEESSRE
jgi:ATP-dependent RNA helicase SUPV3L1/SUV3